MPANFKCDPVRRSRRGVKVLKKYELLNGDNAPLMFRQVEAWVLEVSKKRYKSLKHIVRLLADKIVEAGYTDRRTEDLVKVRAFFRWCTENIRYGIIILTVDV